MKPDLFNIEDKSLHNQTLKSYLERKNEGDSFLGATSLTESLSRIFGQERIKIISFVLIFGSIFLFLRVFWLQIWRGSYYYNLAEGNRIRIEHLRAERGLIFDRNNHILAQNVPDYILEVIPTDLPKDFLFREKLYHQVLAHLPAGRQEEFLNKVQSIPLYTYEPINLLKGLSHEEAIKLKIDLASLPAFRVDVQPKRIYPVEMLLSHLIGYTGKISKQELANSRGYLFNDEIGKSGVEFFYEAFLRGQHGQKEIEIDNLGRERRLIGIKNAEAGKNLVLNLDLELQRKLAESLTRMIQVSSSKAGAAVALDPQDGSVLALVSYPFFDNNLLIEGLSEEEFKKLVNQPIKPFFNRAVAGEYPSGSIIKPLIALAGLEEKIITPTTTIVSSGGIAVNQWFFADWKPGGHGITNVIKGLAESVNTFFYYLGAGYGEFKGLGPEKISSWLHLFGLGQLTDIDLAGEKSGLIPDPDWKKKTKNEAWYIGDTYHLSIGQGDILVTPLQVASYTAALANGGRLFQPQVLRKVLDNENKVIINLKPKLIRENLASLENIKTVKEGLRAAVLWGSARALNTLPIKVAGKTGTAEVGQNKKPHAWFTCFAPYENPEIVLTVLVENGGEGSQVALPVAKEVLEWWANQKSKIKNEK